MIVIIQNIIILVCKWAGCYPGFTQLETAEEMRVRRRMYWMMIMEGLICRLQNESEDTLAEYYENYERDQRKMQDLQMEAVRKR